MNNNKLIPKYFISVAPVDPILIEGFFNEEGNPLREILRSPNYLRYMGWNLLTLDSPKIVKNSWQVKNGDVKTIRLYDDGSLVSVAYANSEFLGWGKSEEEFEKLPQLNSLAIIEFTTEFVHVYSELLKKLPEIKKLKFIVGLVNTTLENNKKLFLTPRRINDIFFISDTNESNTINSDFSEVLDIELKDNNINVNTVAYKLIEKVFNKAGVPSDKIPYTHRLNTGEYAVNADEIAKI